MPLNHSKPLLMCAFNKGVNQYVLLFLRENMYQDHLHKITEDSESQRTKRDEIIKTLRKQVTAMEVELQRTRVQLEADRYI